MFCVKDVANENIQIMSGHATSKDLKLKLKVRSTLKVRSDKRRVEQVLMNLLYNAILSSPRGGEIELSFAMEPFNLK